MLSEILIIVVVVAIVAVGAVLWLLGRNNKNSTSDNSDLVDNLNKQIEELKNQCDTLNREVSEKGKEITQLTVDLKVAKTNTQHANKEVSDMQETMNTWEQKFTELAKNALNESALKQSQQLLNDYKQASEKTNQENQKKFSETNEELIKNFRDVSEKVKSLNDNVESTTKTVNTIESALSNPQSIGHASEAILDNTLKSFKLRPTIDYTTQSRVRGESDNTLRPDAMVFLPNNTVMVIDSKASKFMMDMARSDNESDQQQAKSDFAKTMKKHVNDLASKNYRTAVQKEYKTYKSAPVEDVIMIMWLATDGAVDILQQENPDILKFASDNKILITGRSGLWSAISIASQKISLQQQNENQQKIVEKVESLLESVGTVIGHAEKMGRGLKQANTAFSDMHKSINGRLLPRSHALVELGAPGPTKSLPRRIKGITNDDDMDVIDSETPAPPQIEQLDS